MDNLRINAIRPIIIQDLDIRFALVSYSLVNCLSACLEVTLHSSLKGVAFGVISVHLTLSFMMKFMTDPCDALMSAKKLRYRRRSEGTLLKASRRFVSASQVTISGHCYHKDVQTIFEIFWLEVKRLASCLPTNDSLHIFP